MTRKGLLTPFRVGLVVIAGIAAFFVMLAFISRQTYSEKATHTYYATFADATGLGAKSRVQIAGIEVGIIESIALTEDAKARATILIKKEVPVRTDARITKRSASLLGDFLLDIFPGTPEAKLLPVDSEILNVVAQTGVDDVFAALGAVTRDIQEVTKSLTGLVSSDEVGSIKEIIRSMNEVAVTLNGLIKAAGGRLDNILGDVEYLSNDIRGMARGQGRNVEDILFNIKEFTRQANKVVGSLESIIGAGQGELRDSVASIKDTLNGLQKTLKSGENLIDDFDKTVGETRGILAKVNSGDGTVARLLNDDGLMKKIEQTVDDLNSVTEPIGRLETHLEMREEVHWRPESQGVSGKARARISLIPSEEKVYGIEIGSEPRGTLTNQQVTTTTGGLAATTSEEVRTDDFKVSAWIGGRFGSTLLRAGLIESTGGVGADVLLADDKLKLSVDAFAWSNPNVTYPRLRLGGQFRFWEHVYVGAGVDDILNYSSTAQRYGADGKTTFGIDAFLSAGLEFNDEDLKALITIVGLPSGG